MLRNLFISGETKEILTASIGFTKKLGFTLSLTLSLSLSLSLSPSLSLSLCLSLSLSLKPAKQCSPCCISLHWAVTSESDPCAQDSRSFQDIQPVNDGS